jgi:hypothetical protein
MPLVNRITEGVGIRAENPMGSQRGEKGANVVDGGGKWSIVGESGGRAGFLKRAQ